MDDYEGWWIDDECGNGNEFGYLNGDGKGSSFISPPAFQAVTGCGWEFGDSCGNGWGRVYLGGLR